jgi:hypothetical protein
VALLLNEVSAVGDGLLNQFHDVGFGVVNVARGVVLVLAEPESRLMKINGPHLAF